MKKKLIYSILFVSFALTACKEEFHLKIEKNIDVQNTSVSTYSTSETTHDNDNITIIDENVNRTTRSNIFSSGKGNITINGDKAYLDGKEIEINDTKAINVSYDNDKILINGKNVKYKNTSSDDKKNTLEIKVSGSTSKFSVGDISSINSSFNIIQKCSTSNENYLMIDSSLLPYLSEDTKNGFIHLKNGSYKIIGKINIELYTNPLSNLSYDGNGSIQLTCTNTNNFELNNAGIGHIDVNNIKHNNMSIHQSGVGEISLNGTQLNILNAFNTGVGEIKINVPVNEAHVQNSGVGSISATNINSLDATNNGVGEVNVSKVNKVINQKNSGVGNINIVNIN